MIKIFIIHIKSLKYRLIKLILKIIIILQKVRKEMVIADIAYDTNKTINSFRFKLTIAPIPSQKNHKIERDYNYKYNILV